MSLVRYSGVLTADMIAQLISKGINAGEVLTAINGGAAVDFAPIPAAGGNVSTLGLTPGELPVATAPTVLGDSGINAADVITEGGTPLTAGRVAVAAAPGTKLVDGPVAANLITNGGLALTNGLIPVAAVGNTLVDGPNPTTLVAQTVAAWSPVDASGAGLGFILSAGQCVTTGKLVLVTFYLVYPPTADGSNALIGGLPVAPANAFSIPYYSALGAATGIGPVLIGPTPSGLQIRDASTFAPLTNALLSSVTLWGTITYQSV